MISPLGLGDELRAALISGSECWGAICLHREDAVHGFDDREVDVIRRIAPHVAEGLRRAVILGPLRAPAETAGPRNRHHPARPGPVPDVDEPGGGAVAGRD